MRKQSMMGSSKYEFNPNQLEEDVKRNQERYEVRKENFAHEIYKLINSDPFRQEENFSLILEIMREWRLENQYSGIL